MISNAQINNKVDAFVMAPYQLLLEINSIEHIIPDDLKLPIKPPQCETYITEFKKEIWYASYFKNNWYFVSEKPTIITIICNKQTINLKIKIKNSGKLYLKSGCSAFITKGVLGKEQ